MNGDLIRIIAFDPGGTTGWATFSGVKLHEEWFLTEYEWGQLGPENHHSDLWHFIIGKNVATEEYGRAPSELHIVTESFEYRNESRRGLNLMSREYIGIMRLYAEIAGNTVFKQQSPAQAKTFVKNDNLKKLGVWSTKYEERHAMDALRHLFYYLIHTAKIMPEQYLKIGWK